MLFSARTLLSGLALAGSFTKIAAQTYSSCNPLTQGGCPADSALGKSVSIDFTGGASDSFSTSGAVSYNSNGAAFTVSKSGDSPTITSKWYIMFGRVDFVVKAAPGTGIVSSAVLQSDCLDEIDWEWLGGDDSQVQSNYFGKGITTTYNRGAFHGAAGSHDKYHTYTIDWTADQIVWQVDGVTVRVLTQSEAATGQYPQTPMMIKVGAWSGGDPSNPAGTVAWAGGYTDYSAGPFTMSLKSIHATDYSTGTQYTYSGTAGTWQSIESKGGKINSQGSGTPISSGSAPAVTSQVSNAAPLAFGSSDSTSNSATRTGWPWYGTATASVVTSISTATTSISGLPSGWTVTESGKVVPPSSGAQLSLCAFSSSASSPALQLASGLEVRTSWNEQGFPTLVTIDPAAPTQPKSYDSKGFPVTAEQLPTMCYTPESRSSSAMVTSTSITELQSSQTSSTKPGTTINISTQKSTTLIVTTATSIQNEASTTVKANEAARSDLVYRLCFLAAAGVILAV